MSTDSPFDWKKPAPTTEPAAPTETQDSESVPAPAEISTPEDTEKIRIYRALAAGVSKLVAKTMIRQLSADQLRQLDSAPDQKTFADRWTKLKRKLAEDKRTKLEAKQASSKENASTN